jgi:hypothetical protein
VDIEKLPALWEQLGGPDATTAHETIGLMTSGGDKTVDWLRLRLKPASKQDADAIRRLIGELDSPQFQVREKAAEALVQRGAQTLEPLNRTLAKGPPLEVTRRIEAVLGKPAIRQWSAETIRGVRAVQVLEQIGSPNACRLLKTLADGLPEARLTEEARAALKRLDPARIP